MNAGYYILCLILMLPLAALTAFAGVLESCWKKGFFTTFVALLGVVFDPLGEGVWFLVLLAVLASLAIAGLFPSSRPAGFALIAILGAAAGVLLCSMVPHGLRWVLMWVLSPSLAGFGLSVYCALRSFRLVGV